MIDGILQKILADEKHRQATELELIASENYVSRDVLQATANEFTNKYSEGYAGARYYGGQEYIDRLEELTQHRALRLFALMETAKETIGFDSHEWASHEATAEHVHRDLSLAPWAVNVQPLSGSPANLAVYMGVLSPGSSVLAMDLQAGGHLSHGHPLNSSGIYYSFISYGLDADTYEIDYDDVLAKALKYKPAMIVAGFSAYTKSIDWKRFHTIAEEVAVTHGYKPLLMADISHIAGLIAGGALSSPFPFFDIVTTTTHKTLRGPRGALIYVRKGKRDIMGTYGTDTVFREGVEEGKQVRDIQKEIWRGVFPGVQGGPHEHIIFAKAVAFAEVLQPSFHAYATAILANAKSLAHELTKKGRDILTGTTENHIILRDVTRKKGETGERFPTGLTGKSAEKLLERIGISVNKNIIPHDTRSALDPSGIRIGTPAVTTRGMTPHDMELLASLLTRALESDGTHEDIAIIKTEIQALCARFPLLQ